MGEERKSPVYHTPKYVDPQAQSKAGGSSPARNGVMKQLADETDGVAFLHLNRKDLPKSLCIHKGSDRQHARPVVCTADTDQTGQYRSLELKPARRTGCDFVRPRATAPSNRVVNARLPESHH